MTFIQERKKNVGPNKYKKKSIKRVNRGKRSKKKLKNKNSETKKIEPGNPKKIKLFSKVIRNNFGHKKFIPPTSVSNRVLNRLAIASTKRNEFVESNACAIIMQKLANIKFD